jgi:hypothetical protein
MVIHVYNNYNKNDIYLDLNFKTHIIYVQNIQWSFSTKYRANECKSKL